MVEDELEAGGRRRRARADDLRGRGAEDGLQEVERVVRARGDHRELAGLRGGARAEHRAVHVGHARPRGQPGQAAGARDAHGARLPPQRAGGQDLQGGSRRPRRGVRVEQHRHEHLGAPGGVLGRPGHGDAVGGQGLGLLARAVPRVHLVALPREVPGHGGPHDPRAEHRDAHGPNLPDGHRGPSASPKVTSGTSGRGDQSRSGVRTKPTFA
ncbi:MAG: hypothetical protein AVDCRST_MAG13-3691 [uncultured Solirubrobacteraceae bacterium]|uniref:Uncharacterized protein n=1 Tax=uncultured Solirubrobacteraceae bacterium TaxID=1162706 RepID=A0A6J4TLX3_9ACTN|nr:MAG: hypothetical protein AVDCRST_MAG13-3691 [uncultured Solirubrobacteraceae bacterium]